MPKLTLKTERWFDLPGAPGEKIKVVHLRPGQTQKIEADASTWLGKFDDSGKLEQVLEQKPTQLLRKLRAASIIDWKGFYDENGNSLPCTNENKERFLDDDPELEETSLSEFIDKCRKALSDELKPQEEEAEGN